MRTVPAAVLTLAMTAATPTLAQDATDIFLAELRSDGGRTQVSTPVNVTARPGYDNQPWFLPDGSGFLYVAAVDGQMDVFRHDFAAARSTRLTRTADNEFSPSLPGDGSRMLVVRWSADMAAGALWWYTPAGEPIGEATGSVPRVGYYTLADATTLALFINDDTQSFVLADMQSGASERIGERLGGSAPRTIGPGAVSFLRQDDGGAWWLSRLDVASREVTPLVRMPEGVVNYTWHRGSVLAAQGGTLQQWTPGSDRWQALATFEDPALQQISRIAVSPAGDRIALVAAEPKQ